MLMTKCGCRLAVDRQGIKKKRVACSSSWLLLCPKFRALSGSGWKRSVQLVFLNAQRLDAMSCYYYCCAMNEVGRPLEKGYCNPMAVYRNTRRSSTKPCNSFCQAIAENTFFILGLLEGFYCPHFVSVYQHEFNMYWLVFIAWLDNIFLPC